MSVIVNCVMCKSLFAAKKSNAKYCANCNKKAKNMWNQNYKRNRRQKKSIQSVKPVKTLKELNDEARAAGMSYGMYIAKNNI